MQEMQGTGSGGLGKLINLKRPETQPGVGKEDSQFGSESPTAKRSKRSQTIGRILRTGSLKSSSHPWRRSATFVSYSDPFDVTTPYTQPVDLPSLKLGSRSFQELLDLQKQVCVVDITYIIDVSFYYVYLCIIIYA